MVKVENFGKDKSIIVKPVQADNYVFKHKFLTANPVEPTGRLLAEPGRRVVSVRRIKFRDKESSRAGQESVEGGQQVVEGRQANIRAIQ